MLPAFASLGAGTHIVEPIEASCPERIDIGENVYIATGAWLSVVDHHNGRGYDPHLRICDRASLGPGLVVSCVAEVRIGEAVLAGPRVFIGDAYHDYRDPRTAVLDQPMSEPRPIRIEAGAFLGVQSVILPGVTVGERAYVGANAVVTHDVPANAVVGGNPARIIRRWDGAGERWVSGGADELVRLRNELHGVRVAAETDRVGREAAEYWLAELRASASWRATAPLRVLARAARRRRVVGSQPAGRRRG